MTDADLVEVVRMLVQEQGADIWLCGGCNLAGQLVGETDRIVVKRHP
ncbi:hypothetical protein [Rhodococcus sp. NPDC058521]